MNTSCPFCDTNSSISKKIHSYTYWDLFLHAEEKRNSTRPAVGFLALQRHEPYVVDVSQEEFGEFQQCAQDAAKRLCEYLQLTYTGQEVVGFNKGADAGQTVDHAHIHILPIAKEDPEELKGRVGMSAAFEALHRERVDSSVLGHN